MTQHFSMYVQAIDEKKQVIDTLGVSIPRMTDDETCKAPEIECQVGNANSSAFKSWTRTMILDVV
jgi:hypothetical protein